MVRRPNVDERWHIALADFVRASKNPDFKHVLVDHAYGAFGWFGVLVRAEDQVSKMISDCLAEIGLRVISVEDIQAVIDMDDIGDVDRHLHENILKRPVGDPKVVWGTIHIYLAEGEA